MNPVESERLINRFRYVFVLFFMVSGLAAYRSGSVPAVYQSIIDQAKPYGKSLSF